MDPNAKAALQTWLGADTWHTSHTYDTNRFFDFINAYSKAGSLWSDLDVSRNEIRKVAGWKEGEPLDDILHDRSRSVSRYWNSSPILADKGKTFND